MAMLAGPRRKQKVINLRAKNNDWSNDTNKFGQRMLERMGWSSGKGLGANENGMVEHVVARYKNDERGLGFEDKNDQWTKHEDDFDSLLANLSNGDNNKEKLHSGVSLEVKSKKSKARVHYHKYTRGKDLTRYSEKDLANIFGKKSLKNEEKPEEALQNDIECTEKKFTEKGSMEDYFKRKMEAMKSKNKVITLVNEIKHEEETDCGFKGFSGTIHDVDTEISNQDLAFKSFSFYNTSEMETKGIEDKEDSNCDIEKLKKSKKKKKSMQQDEETACTIHDVDEKKGIEEKEDSNCDIEKSKKSKKKKKSLQQDEETALVNKNYLSDSQDITVSNKKCEFDAYVPITEITEPRKKSKKKKYENKQEEPVKKKKSNEILDPQEIQPKEPETEEIYVPKKKKKRRNKDPQ